MGILKCGIGFREGDISIDWQTKYKEFFFTLRPPLMEEFNRIPSAKRWATRNHHFFLNERVF